MLVRLQGSNGTLLTGGAGAPVGSCSVNCFLAFGTGPYTPGLGGRGGDLGQPGQNGGPRGGSFTPTGGTLVCSAGTGGAAGCGIKTNGNSYTLIGPAVLGPVCP
jgi:hypothetical protein